MAEIKKIATRQAFGETLAQIGGDENIIVLDADLSKSTMTCIFKDKYPERHINCGIAEGNMMATAAGIASCGKTVFAASFAMFAAGRAFEQVRNSIGYPSLNVKVVGTHAGVTVGEDGGSHQCLEDIALMRSIPGMTVLSPADAVEAAAVTKAAAQLDGPVYLRLGRLPVPVIFDENYQFEIAKGTQVKEGKDLTIIVTGVLLGEVLGAVELLKNQGIDVAVVNMASIKPIDEEIIINAAKKTGAILTVEEHNIMGGFGSAVAEVVTQNCPVPMKFVGINDTFGRSGTPADLLEYYGLTPKNIAEKAKALFTVKNS